MRRSPYLTREGLDLATQDVRVHVPEGAVPKDGPSAGLALAVAMLSALSRVPVRPRVAMTGEITLGGRILRIGGLKEKLLAASRSGVRTVMLPAANRGTIEELPARDHDEARPRLRRELRGGAPTCRPDVFPAERQGSGDKNAPMMPSPRRSVSMSSQANDSPRSRHEHMHDTPDTPLEPSDAGLSRGAGRAMPVPASAPVSICSQVWIEASGAHRGGSHEFCQACAVDPAEWSPRRRTGGRPLRLDAPARRS